MYKTAEWKFMASAAAFALGGFIVYIAESYIYTGIMMDSRPVVEDHGHQTLIVSSEQWSYSGQEYWDFYIGIVIGVGGFTFLGSRIAPTLFRLVAVSTVSLLVPAIVSILCGMTFSPTYLVGFATSWGALSIIVGGGKGDMHINGS